MACEFQTHGQDSLYVCDVEQNDSRRWDHLVSRMTQQRLESHQD